MTRTIALIYARISQVQTGTETSPAVQIERCYRLALERGRTCIPERDIYADADKGQHSAFTRANVPEWNKLEYRALTDPEVADVIVDDLDRAYRNTRLLLNFESQLKEIGVKLVLVSTGEVETDSPTGMLQFTMKGLLAEMHARDTSYRMKTRHYDALRARGMWLGHQTTLGLKREGKRLGIKLVAGPDMPIFLEFLKLYLQDYGIRSAAQEIEKRGVIPPGHWARWVGRFRRALDALDQGWYDGIMDPTLLGAAKSEHRRRANEVYRARRPEVLGVPLLWRLLICPSCGRRYSMAIKHTKYGRGTYRSYRHARVSDCPVRAQISLIKAHKQVIAWLGQLQNIPEDVRELAAELMARGPGTVDGGREAGGPDIDTQLAKLEQRLSGYEQMRADGDVSRETFKAKKAEIEAQMKQLTDRARKPPGLLGQAVDGPVWTLESARQAIEHLVRTDFPRAAEVDQEGVNRFLRLILRRVVIGEKKKLTFELEPDFAWLAEAVGTSGTR